MNVRKHMGTMAEEDEALARELEDDADFYQGFCGALHDGIAHGLRLAAEKLRNREARST